MLTRKRLLLLNQTDPNLLFEELFNGAAVNTNLWTKTDTYADEEQVTNGTFTSDISGWTDASDAGSSIAWGGAGPKNMSLISDGAGFSRGRASVTAISGQAYTLTAVGTADMTYKIGTSAGGSQIATAAIGGAGVLSVAFTATAATIHIEFSHNAAATRPLDTVSIKATTGLISISGGDLVFAGGKTTAAWADPALVSVKSWARQAGLTIEWQVTPGATTTVSAIGFTDGTLAADAVEAHGIEFRASGAIQVDRQGGPAITVPLSYTATSLWGRIVCKATGAHYYVSTDNRVTWQLIWIDSTVTTTPLYAFIQSYNAALTASKVEVRQGYAKPALLSASPGAPALTPGDELIVNGTFAAWTGDNPDGWTLKFTEDANNKVTQNVSGCEYVSNGGTVPIIGQIVGAVGAWEEVTLNLVSQTGGGGVTVSEYGVQNMVVGRTTIGAYTFLFRRTSTSEIVFTLEPPGTNMVLGSVSVKPVPFDQTGVLEYIGDAGVKLGVAKANITVAAGYRAGFVVCADSATAPTNHIYTYYDLTAGKAYLMKNTTELVAATVAYSAAAEQRVVIIGPVTAAYIGLYYGGALQGTIQGPYDLSAYGTHCHSFQTGASDTVASFTFDTGVGA